MYISGMWRVYIKENISQYLQTWHGAAGYRMHGMTKENPICSRTPDPKSYLLYVANYIRSY